MTTHSGSCLCGAVAYEVTGELRNAVGCHCGQCRKMTGHYLAATAAKHDRFRLTRGVWSSLKNWGSSTRRER